MEVIDVNKKVFSKVKEFEVREDVIVPDTKPDIVNVIDCSGISYIYKIEQTNGKIKLDGNIDGYISYLSVDGDTRGIQVTFSFSDFIEDNSIKENSFFKYNIKIVNTNTKILNERKISNLFSLEISYDVYETQKIEIYNDFETIPNVQIQKGTSKINSLVGVGEAKTSVKEDIKLAEMETVSEILKTKIQIENNEYKISYNKVLAKAEAKIDIIYLTEDNRISKTEANLPIMSFIDIENVKEGDVCTNNYQINNILVKPNNSDSNSINCQVELGISSEVYAQKEIDIITDIYSLTQDINFKSKKVELEDFDNNNIVNINEEVEIEDIKKVFDIDTETKILKNTVSGENSNIEGEEKLKVYYETTNEMGLKIKIITIPFIYKIDKTEKIDSKVLKTEYDISNGKLIFKSDIMIINKNNKNNTLTIIDNVETKEASNNDNYSMIIYLVKNGDSIWKIAKKFKVTMDSIIKINNLENPNLIYPGDKLYIMK